MKEASNNSAINTLLQENSDSFVYAKKKTAIILSAGHGKRIKSQTSKMLHKIWEIPTVERVCNSCQKALADSNIIIVVGIKAEEVVKTVGKKKSVSFALQEDQKGTGHAVQVALENITDKTYDGTVYIFPGDMGLIDEETIHFFKEKFEKSNADMMVLTGIYDGPVEDNYYGRILRVPENDLKSRSKKESGKVIEILEYKEILNLDEKEKYSAEYHNRNFKFSRKTLLENCEFNSGVYAFKFKPLAELIQKIGSNNVQNEIYLTDLIGLFNKNGYTVEAVSPKNQYVLMGFNNKSVLKEMDAIARKLVYEKVKDIVMIDDPDDFFIEENVVEEIMEMDKHGLPLEIRIGKGVFIGKGVKLNYNLSFGKNTFIEGDIQFGKKNTIGDNSHISCFYGQRINVGDNVEIFGGSIIKGNVNIGAESRIESGVRITGSDQLPCIIGSHVIIKGITYIFGSRINENIFIEHSVLMKKDIVKPAGVKADIYHVRFYLPEAEGTDAVKDL
ncbi:MAG: NTP transferase domain-containing protein [Ignavibacteriales bacterium]|nr:NTP transferase domain-containing protein [Ignavibacteriales bacterium]